MTRRRLRRSPDEARNEILKAAEAVLAEFDFNQLTVELLMERTGMTRSSFYHYFSSLEEVATALFGRIEDEIAGAVDDWLVGEPADDPLAATTRHLTRMFEVWREHADLMRAINQLGARDRNAYEQWRGRLVDGYIEKTADFIRRQIALGHCDAPDPEQLASALILMNTGVATDQVSRPDPEPPERLGRAIARVWNSSIYGRY
ncbi:MAG: TetR/AcrR family transcriptional regulator [Deltaproteobacteria bacterium]|nr:TetR/AcrR family transcriptional regulator [Deltaproteobacteria bacterium]